MAKNKFDQLNEAIENTGDSVVTLVTTLVPWGAPALPAWLTFSHLTGQIGIPWPVAVAMAFCVEGLGLAAVATAFDAMRHNKVHAAEKRKVSLRFPVLAYVFYLAVIITVNVVLSLPLADQAMKVAEVVAIALLTLISAPAFIIAVARRDQREIDKEWNERPKQPKNDAKGDAQTPKNDASKNKHDAYLCFDCSESFGSRQAYGAHMRWKHPKTANGAG